MQADAIASAILASTDNKWIYCLDDYPLRYEITVLYITYSADTNTLCVNCILIYSFIYYLDIDHCS